MIITTWNLQHGGGSRIKRILSTLGELKTDILVLTEFRNNADGNQIKIGLAHMGFPNLYVTESEPKLNSVLIACRESYTSQTFPELGNHSQRVIKVATKNFTLFGTYFPGKDEKKHIFDFLVKYTTKNPNEKIIITGDINTGKHYIDEEGATFFHTDYLVKLEQLGYVDAWRHVHGTKKEFTWYSNIGNGFRLDHFFVHWELKSNVKNCYYNHQARLDKISDHSLMTLELG